MAAKRIEGLFFLKESQLQGIEGIVSFLPEANTPIHDIFEHSKNALKNSKPAIYVFWSICAIHVLTFFQTAQLTF